jgi:Zn-dependent protease with chaperone function
MFANFIYFIVVLLIYATYQPSTETNFAPLETLVLFFGLIVLFAAYTRSQFHRLLQRRAAEDLRRLDYRFQNLLTRHSILAVALFAVDIYGLSMPSLLLNVELFAKIPTLEAVLFLAVFVFYLTIVWFFAYEANQKLFALDISRKTYIWSQVTFSIPVLLPYLVLSAVEDLVNALPASPAKDFLASPAGQAVYFLLFLGIVVVVAPSMLRFIWGCKPLEPGEMRDRIERLCARAGIAYADILDWPIFGGRMITAGVMGFVKRFRYLLVTRTLLSALDPSEIESVIAHEIGHVRKKHLLFYLMFFAGFMLISYAIVDLVIYLVIFVEPIFRFFTDMGFNQLTLSSAFLTTLWGIAFLIYFRFVFGYYMRNFERQADGFVFTLFDSARPLISTLEKIAVSSGQSADRPNWHHYSISERIGFLAACESDRSHIRRHDRKIRRSIIAYLSVMLAVGFVGYNLNFGKTGQRLNNHFFEKIVLREIDRDPDNPQLYRVLGDLYYSTQNYEGVRQAYEQSLLLKGDDPHVLNNLAWFYATCEDRQLRDPPRALDLALTAAAIVEEPHILDTLAESYYVNRFYDLAVETSARALKIARDNRGYYRQQLERFKAAAGMKL